jgi:hypothetical protein
VASGEPSRGGSSRFSVRGFFKRRRLTLHDRCQAERWPDFHAFLRRDGCARACLYEGYGWRNARPTGRAESQRRPSVAETSGRRRTTSSLVLDTHVQLNVESAFLAMGLRSGLIETSKLCLRSEVQPQAPRGVIKGLDVVQALLRFFETRARPIDVDDRPSNGSGARSPSTRTNWPRSKGAASRRSAALALLQARLCVIELAAGGRPTVASWTTTAPPGP